MKMKIKKIMLSIAFICVLTIGIVSQSLANVFWGWETTSTTDWSDGSYTYRETCRIHYIFWIGGSEQCTTVVIAGPL